MIDPELVEQALEESRQPLLVVGDAAQGAHHLQRVRGEVGRVLVRHGDVEGAGPAEPLFDDPFVLVCFFYTSVESWFK